LRAVEQNINALWTIAMAALDKDRPRAEPGEIARLTGHLLFAVGGAPAQQRR
jgi:hypothetical protein